MNMRMYFDSENYTGNHLHVGNWKDKSTPIVEGIAWVREDGLMDLFFNDFKTDREREELFINKGYYYEKFLGGYIGIVKTDEEAYAMFEQWVDEVLYQYRNRNKDKTSCEGTE
ncbi:hypothetical protein [Oceanobacillus sp. Castelsardo]|uniref:hypothetical protein n=1 Tax=Oceanobacillus sp. Castelsardo TaxID=1851204 RepID=UPI000837D84F|nr:hypothetical protein [Oceanobacillus sp. Castelsardo]